jgi:hypothetical protein
MKAEQPKAPATALRTAGHKPAQAVPPIKEQPMAELVKAARSEAYHCLGLYTTPILG